MAALSSGGIANGKSWCGWDLEQIKHFKHWRGWPGLARSQVWWALAHGPRWMHSTPGPLAFETDEPGERSLGSHAPIASMEACQARRKEPFFLEQPSGRRRLASMPMSDEQIKEQIFYLETRIERQRAIIDGLEADGYGGEVIRRSRSLLKQMIADLDQFLVQLREARQINVKKNEQKISSSASDASRQNSIDR
jgi:hypothetical protein